MTKWVAVAMLNLALAMGLGAFGTHSLREHLSEKAMRQFQTGSQYHFYLGLTLLVIALAIHQGALPKTGAWMPATLLAGGWMFSGSLYALSTTGVGWWGAVTPIGGVLTIGTLLAVAFQCWRAA